MVSADGLKALLVRGSRKRAIGLVVDDERVAVSQVVHTALGPVEVARQVEDLGRDSLDVALQRALRSIAEHRSWRAAHLAVGLPDARVELPSARRLYTTWLRSAPNREATGQSLLHESLQLTNILIDDLSIDMLRFPTNRAGVGTAAIVAARKRYLDPLLEALISTGLRPYAVEPAAFGLLRLAAQIHRSPGRSRGIVRVFLGPTHGLMILVCGGRPLVCRGFALPPGGEIPAIARAVGPLRILADRYAAEATPEWLLLHGRPELTGLSQSLASAYPDVQVRHHPGPTLGVGDAAFGVAAGRHQDEEGFNLARDLKPRGSFAAVFPWGQAFVEAGVLAAAGGLLSMQVLEVETQAQVAAARSATFRWLENKTVAELNQQRADLTTRAELIKAYLGTRYQWARYLREVTAQLPPGISLTSFSGKGPFVPPGSKVAPQPHLMLGVEADLPPGGTVPAEIDTLLANLRGTPLLKDTLPIIRMSTLKWGTSSLRKGMPAASFSLVCTPESKGKGKAKGAGGKS